jgi:hypothetical protein
MSQSPLEQLRGALEKIKQQGNETILIADLIAYLDTVQESPVVDHSAANAELSRRTEIWKTEHAGRIATSIEMFKSVIEAGLTAIKSVMLVNGGAAVALLAFLGNISARQDRPDADLVGGMSLAMLTFFGGAGCAVAATLTRYLAQAFYGWYSDYDRRWLFWTGHFWTGTAIALTFMSLLSFLFGGILAYSAFRSMV